MSEGSGPSMQQMLQEAQRLQQQMLEAQEQLAEARVEGSAGGGVVRALVSGVGELMDLRISPAVIDPNDSETLVDLILAAVRDANDQATDLQQRIMGPLTQGFGDLPAPEGGPSGPSGLPSY